MTDDVDRTDDSDRPANATAAHWEQLVELYEQAQAMSLDHRGAWLQALAVEQPSVAAELGAMLDADGATPRWLGDPQLLTALQSRYGDWIVDGLLGSGGMGVVYAVHRDCDGVEQQAALKLLSPSLLGADWEARFERERQLLARLRHPHIVEFLDAGRSTQGLPFLVMRRVEGEPITRYCSNRRLSRQPRINLLRQALAAVGFAHGRLVIHRDLKPENLLVSDQGQVQLLDFGIARVLDDAGAGGAATQVLSLGYASPEQLRGEPVGTASDVYALGVLLHELVAERHPYAGTATSPAAWAAAVERPARSASRSGGAVDRDLDAIIARAMHPDPTRRYTAVSQFDDDLARWSRREPVSAQPDSWRYRGGRFVARHRLGVGLGGALVLTILLALVALDAANRDIRAALAQSEHERDRAEAVAGFMVELFDLGDPSGVLAGQLDLRSAVRRGSDLLLHAPLSDPLLRAELATSLARVQVNLGDAATALALLAESAIDQLPARDQAARALVRAQALRMQGQLSEAAEAAEHAAGLLPADASNGLAFDIDTVRAVLARDQGRYADGIALLKPLFADSSGLPRLRVATQLAALHWLQGDPEAAAPLYRQALDAVSMLPAEHPARASPLSGLSILAHRRGDFAEAAELGERALAIQHASLGDSHPHVARSAANLGALYLDAGDTPRARDFLQQALAIQDRGAPSPELLTTLDNLGLVELRGDRPEAARAWLRRAQAAGESLYPKGHPQLAIVLDNLGVAELALGENVTALQRFDTVIDMRRRLLGSDHPDLAWGLLHRGQALLALGRTQEAEQPLRDALALRLLKLGEQHPETVTARLQLARWLLSAGRCEHVAELLAAGRQALTAAAEQQAVEIERECPPTR